MNQKVIVFLSSTQFLDEFKVERTALPSIFRREPFSSVFCLWKIEDEAAPVSPEEQFLRNVDKANIIILLVDNIIRDAVRNEINKAISLNKKVYAFIRFNKSRLQEAISFIDFIRKNNITTTDYYSFDELVDKLETSLFSYYFPSKEIYSRDIKEKSKQYDLNERSLKIAISLLNSNSTNVTREKIIQILVMEKLSVGKMKRKDLLQDLKLYNKGNVLKVINTMIFENLIIKENDYLCIIETKKREIIEIAKKVDSLENKMFQNLYNEYSNVINNSLREFRSNIEKIVSLIIYNTTTQVDGYYNTNQSSDYDSTFLKRIIIDSIIIILGNDVDIAVWEEVILNIFQSNDINIISWINSIQKSYWYLSAFGLDPVVSKIFKENLYDYKIYLDSHIVLRGMLNYGSESQICSDILNKGKNHQVKMYLSYPIFEEIEKAFYNANNAYNFCEGDLERIVKLLESLNKKNDIFESFLVKKDLNSQLDWLDFLNQYYSPYNEQVLIDYIQEELKIVIDRDINFDTSEWGELQTIFNELYQKRKNTISKSLEFSDNPVQEEERQLTLRTNEAKQIELLYRLRKEKSPDYWFVTYDQFIYEVCIELYKRNNKKSYFYPCYIKPNKWLEIINTSTFDDVKTNTFREILISPMIHHIVNNTEAEVINKMLERNIDKKVHEKKILNNMFKEAVNKIIIEDIQYDLNHKIEIPSENNETEAIIKELLIERMENYSKIIDEQNQEILRVKKEKDKAIKRTGYFKAQLTRQIKKGHL